MKINIELIQCQYRSYILERTQFTPVKPVSLRAYLLIVNGKIFRDYREGETTGFKYINYFYINNLADELLRFNFVFNYPIEIYTVEKEISIWQNYIKNKKLENTFKLITIAENKVIKLSRGRLII